ncbi:TPA: YihY family inner membrane protein [Candidatus Poribacteria bacterium]|nr:YihY family inner membrane protein [Candidatus Poribacteria bacterium]
MHQFKKLMQLLKITINERHINFAYGYRCITYIIKLIIQVWQQLINHKCLQQASSLAFATVLSLVPLLAVAFFLLNAFDAFQGVDSDLIAYIKENFLPEYQAEEISNTIKDFTENVNISRVGLIAFFPLLLISMILFNAIETTFNDIWNVKTSRPIFYKFAVFYTIITIGPILITLSIYQAASLEQELGQPGNYFFKWLFASFFPFSFLWLALLLAYKLLPNTVVRWKPAMVGALIASILIELTRDGFSYYLLNISGPGYKIFYGAVAFIPIFASWVFMSWLIVLLGTEFTNAIQNFAKIHLRETIHGEEPNASKNNIIFVNSILAIKLFLTVAENYRNGNAALSKSHIASKFGVSEEVIERIFKRYKEERLILEVEGDTQGYIPARPLNRIYIDQLINAFEGNLEFLANLPSENSEALRILNYKLKYSRQKVINGISIQSLLSDSKELASELIDEFQPQLEDKRFKEVE